MSANAWKLTPAQKLRAFSNHLLRGSVMMSEDVCEHCALLRGAYAIWRNAWERLSMTPPEWSYRFYVRRYQRVFERYARQCIARGEAPVLINTVEVPLARSGIPHVSVVIASGRGSIERHP